MYVKRSRASNKKRVADSRDRAFIAFVFQPVIYIYFYVYIYLAKASYRVKEAEESRKYLILHSKLEVKLAKFFVSIDQKIVINEF